jgi:hypothetical protein
MRRHSYKICFALAALAVTLAVLGTRSARCSSTEEVPYDGKFDLVFEGFSADGALVKGTYTFSGEASHLGKSTGEGSFEKNLMTGIVTANKCTLTGANGDQIFCAVSYKLFPTNTVNVSDLELTFELTGGTGPYEGATGSGKGTGTFDASTNKGSFTIKGLGVLRPRM